jgi:uncharacterized membrane protein YhaH (DUF805 family)
MNLRYLYTSFDGRINRKRFWIASLIMMFAAMLLSAVIFTPIAVMNPGMDGMVALLFSLALLYPACALGVKRLHDRGRSGRLMAVFLAPGIMLQIGDFLGLTGTLYIGESGMTYLPNLFGWTLNAAVLGVGIWALVELGVLKGTAGPNEYGPDPNPGTASAMATG